jgi:hypothetical protein
MTKVIICIYTTEPNYNQDLHHINLLAHACRSVDLFSQSAQIASATIQDAQKLEQGTVY